MSGERIMHQVVHPVHGPDGLSVLYGPGELHEPGDLPDEVVFRAVVADDVAREIAPAHATAPKVKAEPEPVKTEPAKAEPAKAEPAAGTAKATGYSSATAKK